MRLERSYEPILILIMVFMLCTPTGFAAAPGSDGRMIRYELDLETGKLQSRSSLKDGLGAKTLFENGPTLAISNITNQNPGVVTSNRHRLSDGQSVTVNGVKGMTKLNGRLFRVKVIDSNRFELWEDHRPGEPNSRQTNLGSYKVDTRSLGTYGGGGTLMLWSEERSTGAPGSNYDVRVEASEMVDGQRIRPRRGNYFLRSAIYYNKDYSVFSGNSGKNKPRFQGTPPEATQFDFDTEVWFGFSVFVPVGWQDEKGTLGQETGNVFFNIESMGMRILVPGGKSSVGGMSGDTSRWVVKEDSFSEGELIWQDLGEVEPDKGKWTDFVVRLRLNPFSKRTNAANYPGGKNKVYPANTGILQIWKSVGPVDSNGDRAMVLMVNKVNVPVGPLPVNELNSFSVRQYRFGWHHYPTTVTGPIWLAHDEFRMGEAVRDGTGFQDVHPGRRSCSEICAQPSDVAVVSPAAPVPSAPTSFVVR